MSEEKATMPRRTMTTFDRRQFLGVPLLAFAGAAVAGRRFVFAQQAPASAGPAAPGLVEDLVAANRIIAEEGVVDGYGHVSVRHDKDPNRFLLSRSVAPALVTADDLIEYDLDSNPVDAKGRGGYAERFIHGEIYRARSDVHAVVHAHSPSVVPFGVSATPLRPVFHMAGFIGDRVPVFDIRKSSGMTDMLISNAARGRALAQALGMGPAILMRGHGVAVVGPSLPFAVGRSIYLELNARIELQAIRLGGSVTFLDPAEAQQVMASGENNGYARPWEAWKRKALGK
jgi:HCOMODA/2-hydroxy-3-carboxy-muconic semialdehyde decarboxylase